MADIQHGKADYLAQLDYFAAWGGRPWRDLLAHALHEFSGTDLEGQRILEIGTRHGRMACLLALLGGKVVGIDLHVYDLLRARDEARQWKVSDQTTFIAYDGDLDIFADDAFDLVFSKSVLVFVRELGNYPTRLHAKLKPGGKIIFLENGRGNRLLHALRAIRHRNAPWNYRRTHYFTRSELALIHDRFSVQSVHRHAVPPIYLILGHKKEGFDA